MHWCVEHGGYVTFGTGRSWPACYLNWTTHKGNAIWPLVPTLPSYITVASEGLAARAPFDDESLRDEFRRRLNEVDGINLAPDSVGRRPSFPFSAVATEKSRERLYSALEWFVGVAHS